MANINFYLKTGKTNKDGEKSIIMRITYGNKRTVIFLNRMVHPKFWSTSKQNVRPNNRREPDNNYEKINEAIKSYRDKAEYAIDNAFKKNLTLSDKYFKNWFSNQQSENPYKDNDFFSLFDIYLEAIKPGLAPNTIKGYTTVRNFLEKFETDSHYLLDFNSINNIFLDELKKYAFTDHNFSHNYFVKVVKVLKSFLQWAEERDVKISEHYKKFSFKEKDKDIIFLTLPELMKLNDYKFETKRLNNARDLFCFGCYTGLRISDIVSLEKEHIQGKRIVKMIQKSRKTSEIPLNKFALKILKKHSDLPDRPLPTISAQKLNVYIKDCCKIAEINTPTVTTIYKGGKEEELMLPKYKLITSHTARKTFLTTSIILGMNYMAAKGISGHKKEKDFNRYVKVVEEFKKKEMDRTWGKVKIKKTK
ncbi:MAG TPA: tyrosine-type recombinase/integrase [Bacteroidales bacterium]|nr:tyrosine-type recombinase/integrase [Bacteroidales bacterium]